MKSTNIEAVIFLLPTITVIGISSFYVDSRLLMMCLLLLMPMALLYLYLLFTVSDTDL